MKAFEEKCKFKNIVNLNNKKTTNRKWGIENKRRIFPSTFCLRSSAIPSILPIILFNLNLLLPFSANSQQALSITEFLAAAKDEATVLLQQNEVDFLNNTSHDLPWIEKVEFRTRTDEFDFSQQEYVLRLSPHSPRERKSQQKYHNSNIRLHETGQALSIEKGLKKRYELIIDLMYYEELLNKKTALKLVHEDKINVLKKSVLHVGADINDLIDEEEAFNSLERDIFRIKGTLKSIQREIQIRMKKEAALQLDVKGILNVDDIKLLSPDFFEINTAAHLTLALQKDKVELIQNQYELEDAERRNMFRFVETKYEGKADDIFREKFSVGIGIRLPIKGAAKLKLNELKLEQLKAENKNQVLEITLKNEKIKLLDKLQNLLAEYELISKQKEGSQANFSMKQYVNLADVSAYTLLKIRESLLHKDLQLNRIKYKIYDQYIQLLHLSGKMGTLPLRNYLSTGLDTF